MKKNLIGELRIMKDFGITPNFSALQRQYHVDRHTIKKYYDADGIPERKKRVVESKWKPYEEEVNELLKKPHVTYRAAYEYLVNKYGSDILPGDYNSLRNYYWKSGHKRKNFSNPHVLYETPPGKQSQFDWKEDMRIHLKDGTEILFNVFSMTLSYSREHIFVYSSHKTTSDLLHCMIKAINKTGGICEEYLTDNMSAIVSVRGSDKTVYPKVTQFFRDIGSKLILAKAKTPQTKGKDENANKFVKWIYAYDYEFKDEMELIDLIENVITSRSNQQINTGTGLPPATLFEKEKEYLKKLPSRILMDTYLEEHYRQVVPQTQLIYHKGSRYSLSSRYIGETVDIYPIGSELYIYHSNRLIAKHTITQQKINYLPADYKEGLQAVITNRKTEEIEKMAMENLERLAALGKE